MQILIDLFENDEKTFLLRDVNLNRTVVRVTAMCHVSEVSGRLNEKNRQRGKDSLSLWGPAGQGSDVADGAIYHL